MHIFHVRGVMPFLIGASLLFAGGCTSPCDRIDAEIRQLNADTIRDPAIAGDGRYISRFQELAAQSVENGCLAGSLR